MVTYFKSHLAHRQKCKYILLLEDWERFLVQWEGKNDFCLIRHWTGCIFGKLSEGPFCNMKVLHNLIVLAFEEAAFCQSPSVIIGTIMIGVDNFGEELVACVHHIDCDAFKLT